MLCHPLLSAVAPRASTHVHRFVAHHVRPVSRVGRAHVHAHHVPGHATHIPHRHLAPKPADMIVCTRDGAVPAVQKAGAGAGPFYAAGGSTLGAGGLAAAAKAGLVAGALALGGAGLASFGAGSVGPAFTDTSFGAPGAAMQLEASGPFGVVPLTLDLPGNGSSPPDSRGPGGTAPPLTVTGPGPDASPGGPLPPDEVIIPETPATGAVPEPGSLSVLVSACLAVALGRRRARRRLG